MDKPLVGILMGSDSDMPVMEKAGEVLKEMDIPYEIDISSAHRLPDKTADYAKIARARGIEVIIAGAKNAGYLAFSILSIKYPEIAKKLDTYREKMKKELLEKSKKLK